MTFDNIHLQYSILEVIEKSCRLNEYIRKSCLLNGNNSNQAVSAFFGRTTKTLELNLEILINDINKLDAHSSVQYKYSIQRKIYDCYVLVTNLHKELNLLHADWLRSETYIFLEQINSKYLRSKIPLNIVLSDEYTFLETNLNEKFDKLIRPFYFKSNREILENGRTILLPKIEYSNPLNWANLIHELGHIEFDTKKESIFNDLKIILDAVPSYDRPILYRWVEEMYCDVFAARIIGPAYFLSLASYALLQSLPSGYSYSKSSYPPFIVRLMMLDNYMDVHKLDLEAEFRIDKIENTVSFINLLYSLVDGANEVFVLGDENRVKQNTEITSWMPLFNLLKEKLIGQEPFVTNLDTIRGLAATLQNKIPIGGIRDYRMDAFNVKRIKGIDDSGQIRPGYSKISGTEFKQIRNSLTESSTEIWQILMAGWVCKISDLLPVGLDLFFHQKLNIKEAMTEYSKRLRTLDELLLTSIELSHIINIIEN